VAINHVRPIRKLGIRGFFKKSHYFYVAFFCREKILSGEAHINRKYNPIKTSIYVGFSKETDQWLLCGA
jgi:hypothetical protein